MTKQMIYRDYKSTGVKTSLLGMGCMRLPTLEGSRDKIDWGKAQEIIDYAYESGVNYYDTAYVYHSKESEAFIGAALKKYPRESWFLATKFPGFMMRPGQSPAEIFNEQLERCGVDYFDFYLCHNVSENSIDIYTDPKLGIVDYLVKMKEEGKIKRLGFSSHGKPETLRKFASLRAWDFAQIQLNYLDWELQDAKGQYEILESLGIPTVVMEPVRGGRLAELCPEADAILKAYAPGRSIASWAFRYLMRLPNLQVILSGMTKLDQIVDNVSTFERFEPLNEEELGVLQKALDVFKSTVTVPCTACRYCTAECPAELDIPELMSVWNNYSIAKNPMPLMDIHHMPEEKRPDKCLACGQCAAHCPQSIDIPGIMGKMAYEVAHAPRMGPPPPSAD